LRLGQLVTAVVLPQNINVTALNINHVPHWLSNLAQVRSFLSHQLTVVPINVTAFVQFYLQHGGTLPSTAPSSLPPNPVQLLPFQAVQHGATLSVFNAGGVFAREKLAVNLVDHGNGDVTVSGGPTGPAKTFTGVTDIEVTGGSGADRVFYDLVGKLQGVQAVHVRLSGGDDSFRADIDANGGQNLGFNVDGGAGNDSISLNVNRGLPGNVRFNAIGGTGNNTLTANLFPGVELQQGTVVGIILTAGGAGNDTFTILSFANVDADSTLFFDTSGPTGKFFPGRPFLGTLHEDVRSLGIISAFSQLNFSAHGGAGVNNISADVVGPLFPGTVSASEVGGPLNDNLRLTVGQPVNYPIGTVHAYIDGAGGTNDTAVHTANVSSNCENDTVI
jgi:hypothetical protein